LAIPAHADDGSGAYIGGNFGRARNSYDSGFIDSQLQSSAAAGGTTLDLTARSTAKMSDVWSADLGYLFTPYVGLEASFLHLGEIRYIVVGNIAVLGASQTLLSTSEVTSHGPTLALVLRLPLAETFAADLRIGDYFGKATLDNNTSVAAASDFTATTKSSSSLLADLGGAYTIAGHYSVRVDFMRIEKSGDDRSIGKFSVNVLTAGISYTF
jgi:hypothetical protein